MALGTGLASQVMVAEESTPGTAVTVTHPYEFDSESVNYVKNILQGTGLHAGGQYNRAARRVVSTVTASGDITMEHSYNNMEFWWKKNLGNVISGPTVVNTPAFKTIIGPGGLQGTGITYQKGVPETSDGTVEPLTFNGGKVTGWEFNVANGAIATLKETMDFWNVATATSLASASYIVPNPVWNFSQAAIKFGGTPSTTSSVTSISAGVSAVTLINGFTLTGTNPLKVDRFGLGNAGIKKEQLENDYRTLTGSLAGEFTNRTELYDLFKANTQTSIQFTMTGPIIASTSTYLLDIVLPAVFFDTDDTSIGGPDVVPQTVGFTVVDDGTNNVIQVTLVDLTTTI